METKEMTRKLKKFLKQFPDDAKSWRFATDEIRDLARYLREEISSTPLDFTNFKTPSEWNTEGKKYILKLWRLCNNTQKEQVFNKHIEWF